ncbi:hypothetical protein B5P43_22080 [Bacillus sp. SRB_336]|nr:hypothetical protein B5P43_22080 [Bacillus sp. SRB_336]
MAGGRAGAHSGEPHAYNIAGRLNWLRAGVLGANDGIVSVAATVVGVAGVTNAPTPILVAEELTEHDALAAHLATGLNIDQDEAANPWQAAYASAAAFTAGAILPLLAILLPPASFRIPVTFLAVLVALAMTGTLSAGIGGSSKSISATRLVVGGGLALAATYGIGTALGASGIL